MSSNPVRPFNALNGEEVKNVILTTIKNHLDADSRFKKHLAYPQIAWRFALAIDAYPMEPSKIELNIGPQTVKAPGAELLVDDSFISIDIKGGQNVNAPAEGGISSDAARREAGLPVPAPTAVRGGPGPGRVTVDVPDATPKLTAPTGPDSQREVTNVPSGDKIFARSVTQRTAAAPEGVETVPQAGSKPTIEDVQEIIRREEGAPPEDTGSDIPPAA